MKYKLVFTFSLVFIFLTIPVRGVFIATYTVAKDGTGDFSSINAAANSNLNPGDIVLVKPGVYEEKVNIPKSNSGTSTAKITFKAYDPKNRPVIDGSRWVGPWSHYSNQIYRASVNVTVHPLIIDDHTLDEVNSISSIREGTYYQSGNIIYTWIPGGGSPASHVVGIIEKSVGWPSENLITINADHITLSGFVVRHSYGKNIQNFGDYVRIENCESKFANRSGISNRYANYVDVFSCDIHDNGLMNYPRQDPPYSDTGNWPSSLSYVSGSNARFIGNRVYNNHGEGIGSLGFPPNDHGTRNIEVRNNIVFDNWSVNIWMDHATNPIITNNIVYNSGHQPRPDLTRSNPPCITFAEEDSFGNPGDLNGGLVANNILIGCREGFLFWYDSPGSGLKNLTIANNTFINQKSTAINIQGGNHVDTLFMNNIIYDVSDNNLANVPGSGITFSNNLWSSMPESDARAKDGSDKYGDPNLKNPNHLLFPGSVDPGWYQLTSESELAINSGHLVSVIPDDFWGAPRPAGRSYDIGAHEFGSTPPTALSPAQTLGTTPSPLPYSSPGCKY
jgi:hypothetical protein